MNEHSAKINSLGTPNCNDLIIFQKKWHTHFNLKKCYVNTEIFTLSSENNFKKCLMVGS